MAAIEGAHKLPKVLSSPTTLAYRKPPKRDKPFYKAPFTLTKEQWQRTLLQPWLRRTDPLMPPYPYKVSPHFPEANYGLYGGGVVTSGNKISKGRNKGKILRKWFPNIRFEHVESKALGQTLHIPIRARVMRTIEKVGGLDEYLLGDKPSRIKELGLLGWKLRYLVMQTPMMQARFARERRELGLPDEDPLAETFADVWNNPSKRAQLIDQQDQAWAKIRVDFDRSMEEVNSRWHKKEVELGDVAPGELDADRFITRAQWENTFLHTRRPAALEMPETIEADPAPDLFPGLELRVEDTPAQVTAPAVKLTKRPTKSAKKRTHDDQGVDLKTMWKSLKLSEE